MSSCNATQHNISSGPSDAGRPPAPKSASLEKPAATPAIDPIAGKRDKKSTAELAALQGTPRPLTIAVVQVPTDQIVPSPLNKRVHVEDEAFAALCESIKAQGLLQPIIVRPGGPRPDGYEIVCGERRWRAHRKLGVPTISCLVRAMDDRTAQIERVTENMHRKDLTLLEEAAAVQELLNLGLGVEMAAKRVGRSPAYISRRAKLTKLITSWAKEADDPGRRLPAAMLELIAVLPEETQKTLWEQRNQSWVFTSAERLKDHIRRECLHLLSSAGWDTGDATLAPGAGACNACPQRSTQQAALVAELVAEKKGEDRCLNPQCWKRKSDAWIARRIETVRTADPKTVLVRSTYNVRDIPADIKDAVWGPEKFTRANRNTRGARTALVVSGPDAGAKIQIVERGSRRTGAPRTPRKSPLGAAEKRQQEHWKAYATALYKYLDGLKNEELERLPRRWGNRLWATIAAQLEGTPYRPADWVRIQRADAGSLRSAMRALVRTIVDNTKFVAQRATVDAQHHQLHRAIAEALDLPIVVTKAPPPPAKGKSRKPAKGKRRNAKLVTIKDSAGGTRFRRVAGGR